MREKQRNSAILAYHEVMPDSTYSYCIPCSMFQEHLQLLRTLSQETPSQFGAQVTFDDGEQSQYHNAVPLLAEHGIKATYFVTPGLISTAAKFLSWSQLKELRNAGHSVQSHGWSHKFLTTCTREELAHELKASKEAVEDKLGCAVDEISVPGGRWDRRVLEACGRAGYKRVYVSEPWINAEICGVSVLGRFMVRRTTSMAELGKMVRGDKQALWNLKMRSQVKKHVVKVIGDGLYHRLWCRLTGYNEFEEARQQSTYF
jgi:peptidoglycan/xylan/chitin deacetylase (PgdA/CDA1 family)